MALKGLKCIIDVMLLILFVNASANDKNIVLESSNLPLVVINTNGGTIVNEPKIMADMKIIYNEGSLVNKPSDPGNIYSGKIGIEIRGRYSAGLPQKPYGIETRDAAGNNLNVSILGMPEENDWILLANYNDKTFIRNMLSFHLFQKMGHYAPRHRLCEVIINNEYQGIYIFTEKIKQDKNRVDIADLNIIDNAGDEVTGGYIFKTDYYDGNTSWKSSYTAFDRPESDVYFVYEYPNYDEITTQQKDYIRDFIDSFDEALRSTKFADPVSGYPAFIDVNSFVDYFIIGELTRNVDAYKKSRFFYKDKDSNGGLLHSGPVWDFDWALKNINECIVNNTDGSGWAYEISSVCQSWPVPPGWMTRLLEDPLFAIKVKTRYVNFRKTIFSETYIANYCDSIFTLVNEAQARHYQKWPILGDHVGAPEVDPQPATYLGELNKLEKWISTRANWLDKNMQGKYDPTDIQVTKQDNFTIRLFPNPVVDYAFIESENSFFRLEIYNSLGNLVKVINTKETYSFRMNTSDIQPGLYILRVCYKNEKSSSIKFFIGS